MEQSSLTLTCQSPAGSSSGSAIAVAAGMAPIDIGTETEGSLVNPSIRQSLFTLKPSLGSVPNSGIMPISFHFDIAGPMCKTVQDTVDVLSVLMAPGSLQTNGTSLRSALKRQDGWEDLRIGTLPPRSLAFDDDFMVPVPRAADQIVSIFQADKTGGYF